MLRFLNGILLGTTSSSGKSDTGGGGGAGNAAFLATLPENFRSHDAFKDVKDVSDLAGRYAKSRGPLAEQLPKELAQEAYFKDYKSWDDLAKSAFNQSKMIGADPKSLLKLPADAKDEKAWGEIYDRLGRPAKVDDYKIPPRGDGKAYSAEDTAFQKGVLPILHEAGITQPQLEKLLPKWDGLMDAMTKSSNEQTANAIGKAEETLKAAWGSGEGYTEKLNLANAALRHYAVALNLDPNEVAPEMIRTKLGQSPVLAQILAEIGKGLNEDGLIGKEQGGGGMTPNEAGQEIAAKQADPKFMKAYTDRSDPGHKDAVETMKRLYEAKAAT